MSTLPDQNAADHRTVRATVPCRDGRTLRLINPGQDWADDGALPLPARVVQTTALADGSAWAGLLADGRVLLAQINSAVPPGQR